MVRKGKYINTVGCRMENSAGEEGRIRGLCRERASGWGTVGRVSEEQKGGRIRGGAQWHMDGGGGKK